MTKTLNNRQTAGRSFIAMLLSVTLGLFVADAAISLLDDTLVLGFGGRALAVIRGIVFILFFLVSMLVYLMLGATPMIPKRFILPAVLFTPAAQLVSIPFLVFHYDRAQQITWVISLCQLLLGLSLLRWIQGTFRIRWPVVRGEQLITRR